jgi:subtilisin family serine protease
VTEAMRPAWSEAFVASQLGRAPTLGIDGAITPEWAWGGSTGPGVRVAVVDSGVDADHPAIGGLSGGVVVEPDAESPDGVTVREEAHGDLYGHGTACAGIIRALAPDCEIYSIRVLGANLRGRASCFAHGLDWAIEHDMQVVNLSLTTTNEDWLLSFFDLADQALRKRIMLVCALSNEPKTSIPAEMGSVFSVAATDATDPAVFYANGAPPAEWGAPGIDIDVAWKDHATISATGNSFAAPHIAGHITRILAKHPGLTCWQMKTVLAELAANRT